jgi:glutaminyl-peptide cyclotransferase
MVCGDLPMPTGRHQPWRHQPWGSKYLHLFNTLQWRTCLFLQFMTIDMIKKLLPYTLLLLVFAACNGDNPDEGGEETVLTPGVLPPQNLAFNVVNTFPHDTSDFTEGLQVVDGKMYEGTGETAQSVIKVYDIKTGSVSKQHKIADTLFGEGIQVFKGKLYQLTYQNHLVLVYDLKDITKPIQTFTWPTEGWGMTNDGTHLIVSDGSPYIYYVNPADFSILKKVQVLSNTGPLGNINELEYIDGFIYANVFMTDTIVKINPANGHVVAVMDCRGLLQQYASKEIAAGFDPSNNVLNGIAWDSAAKKMYITGKNWPKLFEVALQ